MTLTDFLSLSKALQDQALANVGEMLINYAQDDMTVQVYRLSDFFVKVIMNSERKTIIQGYNNLDNLKLFEPTY